MTNNLLDDLEVIEWCYQGITDNTLADTSDKKLLDISNKKEKKWGNDILKKYCNYPTEKKISQWTTKLCEEIVKQVYIRLNYNIKRGKMLESSSKKKKYSPDWECEEYVIEVKGRSWTTPGTAGEKILGVPLKYAEIPKITNKKLLIVLVGYQEYEGKNNFGFGNICNSDECNEQAKQLLDFCKNILNIEYICFTDLLKKIGYNDGCWLKKEF